MAASVGLIRAASFAAFVVVLLAWLVPVRAQVNYGGAGGTVSPPPLRDHSVDRLIRNVTGGVEVEDLIKGRVGTQTADMALKRTITARALANGIARAALGPAGIVTGIAIASAIELARCKAETGSYLCDPGISPGTESVECWGPTDKCLDPAGALSAAILVHMQSSGAVNCGVTLVSSNPASRNYVLKVGNTITAPSGPCAFPADRPIQITRHSIQERPKTQCPDGTATGPDGLCPTGTYQPATSDQVGEKLEPVVARDAAEHLREELARGTDLSSVPSTAPKLSGPASVAEPQKTTTTTGPDGVPRTTTTQVTHQITYNNNSYSYTTVTVNNYPDGTSETTQEAPKDKPTDCEKDPERAGCLKLGQPSDVDLPKKDIPVTYTPMSGWGPEGGSCPPPVTVSMFGHVVTVDNQLYCTYLAGIRFAVVGSMGIMAALIFMGGFKS